MNLKNEQWRKIPNHDNYQMSNKGRVHSKHEGLLNPRCSNWKKRTGCAYYLYSNDKKGHMWTANRWFQLVWPELELAFTEEYKEQIIKTNNIPTKEVKNTSMHGAKPPDRKCKRCGVSTFNYWCDTCRLIIRTEATGAEPTEVYRTF
jgi:hypothetical protein